MQLKSRLVFLYAHKKVYRLRNILVAYLLKEPGAALPHHPAPCQVYNSNLKVDRLRPYFYIAVG